MQRKPCRKRQKRKQKLYKIFETGSYGKAACFKKAVSERLSFIMQSIKQAEVIRNGNSRTEYQTICGGK